MSVGACVSPPVWNQGSSAMPVLPGPGAVWSAGAGIVRRRAEIMQRSECPAGRGGPGTSECRFGCDTEFPVAVIAELRRRQPDPQRALPLHLDRRGVPCRRPRLSGYDMRNDILVRDLEDETFKPDAQNSAWCWPAYWPTNTGTTIEFIRGQKTSKLVQTDHVIALSDAWQKGARQLGADQRKQLANDRLNLMAADQPTNGAKGDKDAATWLPPNKAFRCEYVARQTAVKSKYQIWSSRLGMTPSPESLPPAST